MASELDKAFVKREEILDEIRELRMIEIKEGRSSALRPARQKLAVEMTLLVERTFQGYIESLEDRLDEFKEVEDTIDTCYSPKAFVEYFESIVWGLKHQKSDNREKRYQGLDDVLLYVTLIKDEMILMKKLISEVESLLEENE